MIGFEVVASVVLFVLLAVATAMAIIGLLGAGGALALVPCPECRHLSLTGSLRTSAWHYCAYCSPGTVSKVVHARVPHLHLNRHPGLHPHWHWPHLHRRP